MEGKKKAIEGLWLWLAPGYVSIRFRRINKLTFLITADVYEMSLAPVSSHMGTNGFSAF